jgi:deazaflavin-dependent oxidoreductase (nitroreductase family)
MTDRNAGVIAEFRANGGVVGGVFEGMPILLLHHRGARSGVERVTPVAYVEDGGRYVIFASKGGADTNPGWYHNLKAHPEVTIEVGVETLTARAQEVDQPERDRLYAKMVAQRPQFADYEAKTTRKIPVVALTPLDLLAERDADPSQ